MKIRMHKVVVCCLLITHIIYSANQDIGFISPGGQVPQDKCCYCTDRCLGCFKAIPVMAATQKIPRNEIKGLKRLSASDKARYNHPLYAARACGMQCAAQCSLLSKLLYCLTCCCCCYPCRTDDTSEPHQRDPQPKILTPRSPEKKSLQDSGDSKHKRSATVPQLQVIIDTASAAYAPVPQKSPASKPEPSAPPMISGQTSKIAPSPMPTIVTLPIASPTEYSGLGSVNKQFVRVPPSPDSIQSA